MGYVPIGSQINRALIQAVRDFGYESLINYGCLKT